MDSPTPDALSTDAENELICEKLLNWKRCPSAGEQQWYCNYDRRDPASGPFLTVVTPSFTTWAEAGLILEAMTAAKVEWDIHTAQVGGSSVQVVLWHCSRRIPTDWIDSAPLAIRSAALEYIRSLP